MYKSYSLCAKWVWFEMTLTNSGTAQIHNAFIINGKNYVRVRNTWDSSGIRINISVLSFNRIPWLLYGTKKDLWPPSPFLKILTVVVHFLNTSALLECGAKVYTYYHVMSLYVTWNSSDIVCMLHCILGDMGLFVSCMRGVQQFTCCCCMSVKNGWFAHQNGLHRMA